MSQDELHEQIRQTCTYYSELGEGTAGYDLSEEQFGKVFDLINKHVADVIGADEDDFTRKLNDDSWTNETLRNELRAEQRKRAGL